MAFSTLTFLCIFLPVMLIGYYLLPKKVRNIWLVLGSLFFYGFNEPKYLPILGVSIVFNYFCGLLIARGPNKKLILSIGVVLNIASLVYFKYTYMLIETFTKVAEGDESLPMIILPLGISFYTFQAISYIVDVYRMEGSIDKEGNTVSIVEKNFIDYMLYITMFPQLLQGPIERYPKMREAIKAPKLNLDRFCMGFERFIVGLAKKAILADSLGMVADSVFSCDPAIMSTSVSWLGAILYTLQIYYDFSGYTDMAIGLGKLFGFDFTENFNYPYISQSITEFWRRWHISLSNWFRDYLYIPLGGNRKGNVYLNLLVVFLATGIWHGAAWGFLVWGMWHGLFMLIERYLKAKNLKYHLPAPVKWGYTMLAVTLGWVLFKIEDLNEAFGYFATMFHVKAHTYNAFSLSYYLDNKTIFIIIISLIAMIPWAQVLPRYPCVYIAKFCDTRDGALCIIRRVLLITLLLISMMFIVNSTYSPFIYLKF